MDIKVPLPPWALGTVLMVLAARLIGVFVFNKVAAVSPVWVNVFDRVWLILLVIIVRNFTYRLTWKADPRRLIKSVITGVGAGFALFVLAQGLEQVLGFFFSADKAAHPLVSLTANAGSFRQFMLPFFIGAVLVPVSEELFYRGLAYPVFKRYWGVYIALIVNGLFFAMLHFNPVWIVEIVVVAIALAALYEYTGSLVPGTIAHGMVNGIRLVMVYFRI